MNKKYIFLLSLALSSFLGFAQGSYEIALLKYNGGGDWYANPSSLTNLVTFCNKEIDTQFKKESATVDVGDPGLWNYPLVHLTGHGNVLFSDDETQNLRNYLIGGGFLHIDDNYGLDQYIRPQIKKVFPELDFIELPFSHPIYHQKFDFNQGPPKIHEHDELPAQGFGLFYEGRMVCYYSFQSDLGDGWEDFAVHKDSDETRLKALQMGANMVQFVFTQQVQ
ncbi:MAG: hypothetical protein ACI8ZO_001193 [Flavobacteriales bacterium]|jgi:hypothetical protein